MNLTLPAWLRRMLGVRKERSLARPGAKPPIGAGIACADVRMTIQAGMSEELWRWLAGQGWRELTYRGDRRRYRDVPKSCVTELIDAHPEDRAQALAAAVEQASFRPVRT